MKATLGVLSVNKMIMDNSMKIIWKIWNKLYSCRYSFNIWKTKTKYVSYSPCNKHMGLECNGISEDNQTSIHNQQLCFGLAACSDLTRKQDPYRQVFSLQSILPVRANGICCANYLIFRKYFFLCKSVLHFTTWNEFYTYYCFYLK